MGKNETKRYVQISVHILPKTLEDLQKLAELSERSVSAQARLLIDKGLKDESNRQS